MLAALVDGAATPTEQCSVEQFEEAPRRVLRLRVPALLSRERQQRTRGALLLRVVLARVDRTNVLRELEEAHHTDCNFSDHLRGAVFDPFPRKPACYLGAKSLPSLFDRLPLRRDPLNKRRHRRCEHTALALFAERCEIRLDALGELYDHAAPSQRVPARKALARHEQRLLHESRAAEVSVHFQRSAHRAVMLRADRARENLLERAVFGRALEKEVIDEKGVADAPWSLLEPSRSRRASSREGAGHRVPRRSAFARATRSSVFPLCIGAER